MATLANTCRVAITWEMEEATGGTSTSGANVMHFLADGVSSQDVLDEFESNVVVNLWRPTDSDAHITLITAKKLDGVDPGVEDSPPSGSPWQGASGDQGVPAVAALVSLRTGLSGRRNRGRLYIPFVTESSMAGGRLSTTPLADLQSAWDTFATAMATAGMPLLVCSLTGNVSNEVTQLIARERLATQRRRQSRVLL